MLSLEKLKIYIQHYKNFLRQDKSYSEMYKWASLKTFQENWDIKAEDFLTMYDASFQNEVSEQLWSDTYYFPKATMIDFIKMDEGRCRLMFEELFDESRIVQRRIDQFIFHCDDMIYTLKEKVRHADLHYHDGNSMISIYLAFRYPAKYAIYKPVEFKSTMDKILHSDIPSAQEMERFYKLMHFIQKFLTKEDELVELIEAKISDEKYFKGDSTLLAQDFYWCCGREGYAIEEY